MGKALGGVTMEKLYRQLPWLEMGQVLDYL
jgi:hypothetical protein